MGDFARLLNSGPIHGQFKIISTHSDLNNYINRLEELIKNNNETSKALLELAQEISEQIDNISKNSALDHKYYYIFSYKSSIIEEEEAISDAINKKLEYSKKVFSTLNNRGVKVIESTRNSIYEFLLEELYRFYNRKQDTLTERINRIDSDNKKLKSPKEKISVNNLLAPKSIDLKNKDYLIIDGIYYAFLIIEDFPSSGVEEGWLNHFTNVGEGFDFDLIYERAAKVDIRSKVKRTNKFTLMNADQMGKHTDNFSKTKNIIYSNEDLISALETENEFFYFTLICTITSITYDELIKKQTWFKDHLESFNFKVKDPVYEYEDCYKLTQPLAKRMNYFFNENKRNVLTSTFINFYPFTTANINEVEGVSLGLNKNNFSPIILDPFNPVTNSFIFGTTGSGKSFMTMLLTCRLRLMQTQVFVISPVKGHEYRRICNELNGSFIELGPGSKDCINILEVKPVYRVSYTSETENLYADNSFLNEKIEELIKFFSIITRHNLSIETKDLLSPFLVDFYLKYGITDENNSIYIDNNKKNVLKPMPVLGDLKEALEKSSEEELKKLAVPLKKFTEGNLKYFNNQTNVNLDNKYCVIDLSRIMDYEDTRSLVNFIVQNYVWSRVRTDTKTRKAIIYEEIWKLIENEETAETIKEVFKTIRGYYGIAIGVTQNLEDLVGNNFNLTDSILNNCSNTFILNENSDEASKLQDRLKLTQEEYNFITGAKRGDCLLVTPKQHIEAQIIATATESKLFETDGNKLSKL